ncbi:MFS transporter, partial [Streptomyces sp. NPDC001054]
AFLAIIAVLFIKEKPLKTTSGMERLAAEGGADPVVPEQAAAPRDAVVPGQAPAPRDAVALGKETSDSGTAPGTPRD